MTSFHKCRYCGKRIKKHDRETVVRTSYDGYGVYVDGWYCNKKCARLDYLEDYGEIENAKDLNDYITKNGGKYEL